MKTIKAHLKTVALFFSILILFQGCTVYKSANVTLDEATKSETVAKVKTNNNRTQKFKRIELDNGHYYGIRYIYGKMNKIQIDTSKVEKIQLKDKPLSFVLSIGIPPVIFFGLAFLALSGY